MATDTTSVGGIAIAFITGGGLATLGAAVIALIPSARTAKQARLQYELEQRKAQDAEELALRAQLLTVMTQLNTALTDGDTQRRRAIEAEEALSRKTRHCEDHGGYCQLTDEERAKRFGKGKGGA